MHSTLPPVYLTFWLLSRSQIALFSCASWLIFTPSNHCLPISNSQPLAYCFSLIAFDHFSSWVRVPPEAGGPLSASSSITEWWKRGEVGESEGWRGVSHSWVALGSAMWNYEEGRHLFHGLDRVMESVAHVHLCQSLAHKRECFTEHPLHSSELDAVHKSIVM